MNAPIDILPPPLVGPLDDGRVALADAVSAAFLDRLARERRDEARRQSMRVVVVPGYVFEEAEVYLIG